MSTSFPVHSPGQSIRSADINGIQNAVNAVEDAALPTPRGTADPNPGAARLLPGGALWRTMPAGTAPTLTLTQTTTSSITSAVNIPSQAHLYADANGALDARIGYFGGFTAPSASYPYFVSADRTVSVGPGTQELPRFFVEFELDTAQFEVITWGNGGYYRVLVDGQWVSAALAAVPADGNPYLLRVNFGAVGGRQKHQITLELSYGQRFGGLNIGPNDTVWRASAVLGPRVIVAADSFGEGTGTGTGDATAFYPTLAQLLGWRDVWGSSAGGTGYWNPGVRLALVARYEADIVAHNPDVVIITLGLNDQAHTPLSDVQAAINTTIGGIRAGLPDAAILTTGPLCPGGSPSASYLQIRDYIAAATLAAGGLYVDNLGGPAPYDGTISHYVNTGWMTGTGHVGATTGSGNADIYTSSDGTHPAQIGHDYLGRRLAAGIAAGLPV